MAHTNPFDFRVYRSHTHIHTVYLCNCIYRKFTWNQITIHPLPEYSERIYKRAKCCSPNILSQLICSVVLGANVVTFILSVCVLCVCVCVSMKTFVSLNQNWCLCGVDPSQQQLSCHGSKSENCQIFRILFILLKTQKLIKGDDGLPIDFICIRAQTSRSREG